MKRTVKRLAAWLLTFILVFNCAPVDTLADVVTAREDAIVVDTSKGTQIVDELFTSEVTSEDGVSVVITNGEKILPKNGYVQFTDLSQEKVSVPASAKKSVKKVPAKMAKAPDSTETRPEEETIELGRFALSVMDANGNEWQLEENEAVDVNVKLNIPLDKIDSDSLTLISDPEGSSEEIPAIFHTSDGIINGVSFTVDNITSYVIKGTETIYITYLDNEGKTWDITVEIPEEAHIPNGSELVIKEVDDDAIVAEAAEAIGVEVEDLKYVKLLDISIWKNGKELQPDAPISVSIKLKDTDELSNPQVVHFGDEIEILESETEDNVVSFETKGFSIYAIVDDGNKGDYARMSLHFMHGNEKIATYIIKNSDTFEELKEIISDPGAGTMLEGEIFKGWFTSNTYTVDDAEKAMDIDAVRKWAANKEITENEDVNLYAMIYKSYTINYLDENGVGLGSESVLLAANTENQEIDYEINMPYEPKDDEHDFQGWYISTGEANIVSTNPKPITDDQGKKLYQNGTKLVIRGSVTFSVNAPEGHWLVFDENGNGATYNAPQFVKSGDKPTEPDSSAMRRYGYDFGGWFTDKDCINGNEFDFTKVLEEKTTIYAKWTPAATANYTVIIWKQNVDADGYDFEESISLSGNTATKVNSVVQRGTGDNAYVIVNGVSKTYTGFHLKEFDQEVVITPEGDAIVNVYYDRIIYTLRFFYARSYSYNNRTYIQVNCNNEGFLQGIGSGRSLDQSLTHRIMDDYTLRGGSNTWKDVNNDSVKGNPRNLVSNSYLAKEEVASGSYSISNVTTDVVTGSNSSSARRVTMTYYYLDVAVRYQQDLTDLWPTPNSALISQRMTGYNRSIGNHTTISPLLQGSWTLGYNLGGTYSELDMRLFRNNETTAYLITYWRYEDHYTYQYNVYFSALEGETASTTYKGYAYVLQNDLSYSVANGQGWANRGAPTDSGAGYWDVGSVTFPGTSIVGRVDEQNGTINVYYNRVTKNIVYKDGIYVDGNNNQLDNRKSQQLNTKSVMFGTDLSSYNEGGKNYWRPKDTDEYVFEGWYLDSEGQNPYTFTGTMPQEDITVYAKWRQIQYRVFLHPNVETDPSLDWGSESQAMNFRISYGGNVSLPTGRRTEWEFVGWYTDPSFSASSHFTDDMRLNKQSVTANYNKTSDLTDNMDKWGNIESSSPSPNGGAGYNSDAYSYNKNTGTFTERDRFWITKKLDLYAKWRAKIVGANGIGVLFNAGNGTITIDGQKAQSYSDGNLYLDQAQAAAIAASTPNDNKYQFQYWVLQKWVGDDDTGHYEDTEIHLNPGTSFEVLKSMAHRVVSEYEADGTTPKVATYTVQVRAEYKLRDQEGTPTYIHFYGNNQDKSGKAISGITIGENGNEPKDITTYNDIAINEAVDILSIEKVLNGSTLYEGYKFLGWAKSRNASTPWATLNADGKTYTVVQYDNATNSNLTLNQVTQIAADEKNPYEDLYAVWDIQKYKVSIKKTVVGGTATEENKSFTISYSYDDTALSGGSKSLKHTDVAQEISTEVPYGTVVTVSETGYTDFDVSYSAERETDDRGEGITPVSISPETANSGNFRIKGDTTITVTNKRQKGTLEISKTTSPANIADNQNFKVSIKNSSGQYLQSKDTISFDTTEVWFDVSVNSSLSITKLPTDTYTVTEKIAKGEGETADPVAVEGYRYNNTSYSVTNGQAAVTKDATSNVTITNNYTELTSAKIVKDLVDPTSTASQTFTFYAKLEEGTKDITSTLGTLETSEVNNGWYEFTISADHSADGTKELENLPVGAKLTIREVLDDGSVYTVDTDEKSVNSLVALSKADDGTTSIPEANTLKFTNTRKSGALEIKKATNPENIADSQNFKVSVKNSSEKYLQNKDTVSFGDTEVWFDVSVSGSLSISNLPTDTYTVTEKTAKADGETTDPVAVTGYRYDDTTYSVTNGEATVEANKTATVTITNKYTELTSAQIVKDVVDSGNTTEQTFTFYAKLMEGTTDRTSILGAPETTGDYDGYYKFTISAKDTENGTKAFANLPVGTQLTVVEALEADSVYTVDTAQQTVSSLAAMTKSGDETTIPAANTLTFTNTRKTKDITVTKTFSGLDRATHIPSDFKIEYVGNEDTTAHKGTLTLSDGTKNGSAYTWTIKDAKVGEKYTFTEDKYTNDMYTVITTAGGTANNVSTELTVSDAGNNKAEFVNTYTRKTAQVFLGKQVTGNMGDRSATFHFTVTVVDTDGTAITINGVNTEGVDITRKHGEATLLGPTGTTFPVGATVTITETPAADYTTTAEGGTFDQNALKVTFTVDASGNTVIFKNNKEVEVDTGVPMDTKPYNLIIAMAMLGAAVIIFGGFWRRRFFLNR